MLRAALAMASAASLGISPRSRLAMAQAHLTSPRLRRNESGRRVPLTGKFRTARCVLAPQSASTGTSMGPMESFSVRVGAFCWACAAGIRGHRGPVPVKGFARAGGCTPDLVPNSESVDAEFFPTRVPDVVERVPDPVGALL